MKADRSSRSHGIIGLQLTAAETDGLKTWTTVAAETPKKLVNTQSKLEEF